MIEDVYTSSKASYHTKFDKNIGQTLVASDWKDPQTATRIGGGT